MTLITTDFQILIFHNRNIFRLLLNNLLLFHLLCRLHNILVKIPWQHNFDKDK